MIKLYKRIFTVFILCIIVINLASFSAGLDRRQLYNFFFYSERTAAVYYLAKHIIFESGVYLKQTSSVLLSDSINNAAAHYGIDSAILHKLAVPDNEFRIAIAGGMGLTSIAASQFMKTGLSDPYDYNENLLATAFIIKQLTDEGFKSDAIVEKFLLNRKSPETLKILSPSYFTYIQSMSGNRL